jgi:hypothetical protein
MQRYFQLMPINYQSQKPLHLSARPAQRILGAAMHDTKNPIRRASAFPGSCSTSGSKSFSMCSMYSRTPPGKAWQAITTSLLSRRENQITPATMIALLALPCSVICDTSLSLYTDFGKGCRAAAAHDVTALVLEDHRCH